MKIIHNTASAGSKTHEFKLVILENRKSEELLQFLNNSKKAIEGEGNTIFVVIISYLCTLIHEESPQ